MDRLEEELTCPICCDIFVDPRVLPCSHTFCQPCLQGLLRGPRLSCPSCRAVVAVSGAGPAALPINFAVKAIIDKWRQEERGEAAAAAVAEAGMCEAHPRQPLNIYCVQDRRLVCGQCLTIGKHRGHAIDDLQSAYRRAREAWGQLQQELGDQSRSKAFSCSQRLQQHKARCQSALQSDREAVLRYFKELGDALEHQKEALLSALDELDGRISEKYDPLIEEVEKLKLEESELKELHSAVEKEESPLLFLEKLDGLQLRLHALQQKQLPEPEAVEVQPRMENVLQDTWSKTELGQVHRIRTPRLQLAPKSRCSGQQTTAAALWAALTEPNVLLLILICLVAVWHEEISSGTVPAPLVHLWQFLLRMYRDSCAYLQQRVQELCHTSVPLELCRRILPEYFD
ncbi:tripartite motif-containing protein 59 [Prinia subflava]|uniref:tripartite motif-containing protein 59 n=1 Tax=Prinia subflava TaxID=208062 RepID=UPI002FE2DA2F